MTVNTKEPHMLWRPSRERIQSSLLYQFMVQLSEQQNTLFHDYHQLHHWSVTHSDSFWDQVWDFSDVIGHKGKPSSFAPHNQSYWLKKRNGFLMPH